jgi:ATP-dependent DNA helicase RecG
MPLKEKSITTSSKSSTSSRPKTPSSKRQKKDAPPHPLDTPVQFVKGVGPRLGALFHGRGLSTARDILTFFPRSYQDRRQFQKVTDLQEGEAATLRVQVISTRVIPIRSRRSRILEVRCADETGPLVLKWFRFNQSMLARFQTGQEIIVSGTPKVFLTRCEITHPEITAQMDDADRESGRIIPIYTEIEGIPTRTLRKILWNALDKFGSHLTEDLPKSLREKHNLPTLAESVRAIHFPEEEKATLEDLVDFNTPAHYRLVYEEFLKFEFLVLRRRLNLSKERAPAIERSISDPALQDLKAMLPFELTKGQIKSLEDILKDLSQPHPMNRLIQGDVGSGKTAVAFLSAGCVIAAGGQVALMAPTEILAEQHHTNAAKFFGGKIRLGILTGKTTAAERKKLYERLIAGEPLLLIGTHALIEEPVQFKSLQYILIDEQHRFGVEQRRVLREKGSLPHQPQADLFEKNTQKMAAHSLILTATPIPRTLALTAYGDLSVSSIRDLPPGRSPVKTHVVKQTRQKQAFEMIRQELKKGLQAYFIYPLVNDSESEGFTTMKSAVSQAEQLATGPFSEYKVGLLHGQLKPAEKAEVMGRFKRNEIQLLVSTTVVEVGVDVPNATVMVIEHADRFGLSQLHQLRGRVGRGTHQSYCFLFAPPKLGETGFQRLQVMERTHDGFQIAEADLEIRGPGEFLGTRQSGGLPFRMANIVRDRKWLIKAREDAIEVLKEDPELLRPENHALSVFFNGEGQNQFERLKTS